MKDTFFKQNWAAAINLKPDNTIETKEIIKSNKTRESNKRLKKSNKGRLFQ